MAAQKFKYSKKLTLDEKMTKLANVLASCYGFKGQTEDERKKAINYVARHIQAYRLTEQQVLDCTVLARQIIHTRTLDFMANRTIAKVLIK